MKCDRHDAENCLHDECHIERLKAQLAAQGEPCAWAWEHDDSPNDFIGVYATREICESVMCAEEASSFDRIVPLYRAARAATPTPSTQATPGTPGPSPKTAS